MERRLMGYHHHRERNEREMKVDTRMEKQRQGMPLGKHVVSAWILQWRLCFPPYVLEYLINSLNLTDFIE